MSKYTHNQPGIGEILGITSPEELDRRLRQANLAVSFYSSDPCAEGRLQDFLSFFGKLSLTKRTHVIEALHLVVSEEHDNVFWVGDLIGYITPERFAKALLIVFGG